MSAQPKTSTFGCVLPRKRDTSYRSPRAFGAPLHDLTEKDLSTPGLVFQIGVEAIAIDVLTAIDGVQFDEAWAERMISKFAIYRIAALSKEHLIKDKLASARTQDLADVEALKAKTEIKLTPSQKQLRVSVFKIWWFRGKSHFSFGPFS